MAAGNKEKAKRKRGWDADENKPPRFEDLNISDADVKTVIKWLYKWTHDMSAWGQDLRDDLIRLEGQAGFPSGDPGDPPGGPPNGD